MSFSSGQGQNPILPAKFFFFTALPQVKKYLMTRYTQAYFYELFWKRLKVRKIDCNEILVYNFAFERIEL